MVLVPLQEEEVMQPLLSQSVTLSQFRGAHSGTHAGNSVHEGLAFP